MIGAYSYNNDYGKMEFSGWLMLGSMYAMISTSFIRRQYYQLFYYIHLFGVFLVFVGSIFHGAIIVYLLFALWVIFTLIRVVGMCRAPRQATFTKVGKNIVRIDFERSEFPNFEAGQYAFINVPQVSFLEFHPFSIASLDRDDSTKVSLFVRTLGDWTEKLNEVVQNNGGSCTLPVLVDAPYGKMFIEHLWREIQICSFDIGRDWCYTKSFIVSPFTGLHEIGSTL
eukprot:UN27749